MLLCKKQAKKGGFMRKNIAIFASGNGTNAENIIRYFQAKQGETQVVLVVCNHWRPPVFDRAKRLDVSCIYMNKDAWATGTEVLRLLGEREIDFIALAGFLVRVPDVILQEYPRQIVNIHPSLLPKYGGKGMYGDRIHEAVIAAGEKESGITIHYINEHYDEGDIIAQYRCPVLPDDTPEELAQRVHALEYEHYPQIIERLMAEL